MRRVSGVLIVLLLAITLSGKCGELSHITIAGFADMQGTLNASEDYRIARIKTLFNDIKRSNHCSLFVVSGDDLMGRYFNTFHGKAIFGLMSKLGIDAYAPGNHEFDHGAGSFAKALSYARFNVICSDLRVKNTPLNGLCRQFIIKNICGIKIGIFSLITQQLPLISSPGNVKLKSTNEETARSMVKLLKRKGCNLIVALTHIGFQQDLKIARDVKGIDLIFGGHSHNYLKQMAKTNNTLIVNGGQRATYIVKVDLYFNRDGKIQKARYRLIKTKKYKPDPILAASLRRFKLAPSVVVGKTKTGFNLLESVLRYRESGFADTVNDILKRRFGVDLVLNNSGMFRTDRVYPPGSITDTMLKNIFMFNNVAYITHIKGSCIKQILNRSAARYGHGGFLQVAGIRFTIDLSKPPQKINCNNAHSCHVTKAGKRITGVTIDGKPLNKDRTYSVLTNDYLIKGGDGYFFFKRCGKQTINTYMTYYWLILNYLARHRFLNEEKPDGRIKIKGR